MTVELRTNPPIAKLFLSSGLIPLSLDVDPWGEVKADGGVPMAELLGIDTSKDMTPELYAELEERIKQHNLKNFSAVSVFMNGLDETMASALIKAFKKQSENGPGGIQGIFFKGTTFGGSSKNMNSVIARILKESLPKNVTVKSGVKVTWTVADLVRYACAIREALENKGVSQLQREFAGAKSGPLRAFGIYEIGSS